MTGGRLTSQVFADVLQRSIGVGVADLDRASGRVADTAKALLKSGCFFFHLLGQDDRE